MQLLNTIRPTTFQKQVIAMIADAPTPKLAAAHLSDNQNITAARDLLAKLGVITFSDSEAQLTDKGQQLATDENIIDQSGQLTDDGRKYLGDTQPGAQQPAQQDDPMMGDPMAGSPMGGDPAGDVSLESFSLLKELLAS